MHAAGPRAVRSQAAGIGVIWLSSLYRNQAGEYACFMVMVSVAGPAALMFVTFCGNPVPSPQSLGTASIMCSQNRTFCAVTGEPFDHW